VGSSGGRGRADQGRPGAGRDVPVISDASGHRGPGRGDSRGHVPRPHVVGTGIRRGPQRARRGRLLARGAGAHQPHVRGDRDHLQALWRQGRQARRPLLQDGDLPPVDPAGEGAAHLHRHGRSGDSEADGPVRRRIITVGAPEEKIEGIFAKFAEGAREAGKDPATMPKIMQLHLSWAETDAEAVANAVAEWPNGGMRFPKQDIRSPKDFEQIATLVRPEDFSGRMLMSADPRSTVVRSRSSSTWASTRSTCTTPAGTRRPGSTSSVARCCPGSRPDRAA